MLELKVLDCLAASRQTQLSNIIREYIKEKDYFGLMSLSVDVRHYDDSTSDDFFHDYLLSSFLKKSVSLDVISKEQRYMDAYSAFFTQELLNRTNARKWLMFSNEQKLLVKVGKEFGRILGQLNSSHLEEIHNLCAHGPGSSLFFSTTGRRPSDKFSEAAFKCTSSLRPFANALMGSKWHDEVFAEQNYYEYMLDLDNNMDITSKSGFVRDFSTFSTVPKTALKDRPIAIEPLLNLFLQKGIGAYIRKRLKKFGIDLRKGQSHNKKLVMDAYNLALATIDLSGASDSVLYQVIHDISQVTVNGRKWFELLKLARTSHCLIKDNEGNGTLVELSKFSSMGNGFTFELESLLFFCLMRVIVPRKKHEYCGVYGDDIIVPEEHAYDMIELLKIYGFKINKEKTFVTGPFKESCGVDVYKNINCRPIFADKSESDDTSAVSREVKLANAIRLYSQRINGGVLCSKRYIKAYSLCLKLAQLPQNYPRVPPEMGGQGLIVPFSDAIKRKDIHPFLNSGLEGYSVPTLSFQNEKRISNKNSFLLHALISIGRTDFASKGFEPILRQNGKVISARSVVPYWDDSIAWDDISSQTYSPTEALPLL